MFGLKTSDWIQWMHPHWTDVCLHYQVRSGRVYFTHTFFRSCTTASSTQEHWLEDAEPCNKEEKKNKNRKRRKRKKKGKIKKKRKRRGRRKKKCDHIFHKKLIMILVHSMWAGMRRQSLAPSDLSWAYKSQTTQLFLALWILTSELQMNFNI